MLYPAGSPHECQERHANQQRRTADDQQHEDPEGRVHHEHELPEGDEDAETAAADGRRNRSHHTDRCKAHHVSGDFEHHLRDRVQQFDDGPTLVSDGRECNAEERGKDDELQDVALRHRVHHGRREQVHEDIPPALLGLRHRGELVRVSRDRDRNARSGAEDVHHHEADRQCDRGRQLEPDDRLEPDPPHRFQVAAAGDADDKCREQQRCDDHLDHAQEHVRQRLDGYARGRPDSPDQDARGQPQKNLSGQGGTARRAGAGVAGGIGRTRGHRQSLPERGTGPAGGRQGHDGSAAAKIPERRAHASSAARLSTTYCS
jgi:hypothetical protein